MRVRAKNRDSWKTWTVRRWFGALVLLALLGWAPASLASGRFHSLLKDIELLPDDSFRQFLLAVILGDLDMDGDGVPDDQDNCPSTPNATQKDSDEDGIGDECDNCPDDPNDDQVDTDEDDVGDACDRCEEGDDNIDVDNDGIPDACDGCIGVPIGSPVRGRIPRSCVVHYSSP
jgi:hypothetical protein